jgi:hypothetical protein
MRRRASSTLGQVEVHQRHARARGPHRPAPRPRGHGEEWPWVRRPPACSPGLGGGQDEAARLDGAGAQEHLPMRLARGAGERRRDEQDLAPACARARKRCGKAQVVADGEAQRAKGVARPRRGSPGGSPATRARFPRPHVHVEHVDLVVARGDPASGRSTIGWRAARRGRPPTASEPRAIHTPASRASRRPASRVLPRSRRPPAAGPRATQFVTSGVQRSCAPAPPPARRSRPEAGEVVAGCPRR